jgi:hypothetical protein
VSQIPTKARYIRHIYNSRKRKRERKRSKTSSLCTRQECKKVVVETFGYKLLPKARTGLGTKAVEPTFYESPLRMLCIFSLAASIIFFLPIQKVLASSLSFEIDTGNGNILLLLELGIIPFFVGLAYQVKDIVFRLIIEYSSLRDFRPYVINNRSIFIRGFSKQWYFGLCWNLRFVTEL